MPLFLRMCNGFAAALATTLAVAVPQTARADRLIDLGTLPAAAGTRFVGPEGRPLTGRAVERIGDMNGDGIDDLAITAPDTPPPAAQAGSVFVVFGRRGGFPGEFALGMLDGTDGFRIDGMPGDLQGNHTLGWRIAAAGDVNGDGLADLIANGTRHPDAVVVFGRRTGFPAIIDAAALDGSNGFVFGGLRGAQGGYGIAGRFDLNSDGLDDIAVGYSQASTKSVTSAGRIFVLFGRRQPFPALVEGMALQPAQGFRIEGTRPGQRVGSALASVGDVDSDGFRDLAVTATPIEATDTSELHVIHSRSTPFPGVLDVEALDGNDGYTWAFRTRPPGSEQLIADLGDINADGLADMALARSGDLPSSSAFGARGSIYVLLGSRAPRSARQWLDDLDGRNGFRVDGSHPTGHAGRSIAGVGDFNGDGIDDFATSAEIAANSNFSGGIAWVLYGRSTGWPARWDLTQVPETEGVAIADLVRRTETGRGIAAAGDVNGDGGDDLLIGSPILPSGWAHVVHGVEPVLFGDGFEK